METPPPLSSTTKLTASIYTQYKLSYGDIEVEQIFDIERDHYQIISVGWNNHASAKYTEVDIALELIEMDVPKHNIVIGFHTPKMRQRKSFGVG